MSALKVVVFLPRSRIGVIFSAYALAVHAHLLKLSMKNAEGYRCLTVPIKVKKFCNRSSVYTVEGGPKSLGIPA